MTVKELRRELDSRRGEQKKSRKDLEKSEALLVQHQTSLEHHEQAREVIKECGLKTQEALAFHISDITSLALQAVFGDSAYNLVVDFVQRRNKTECDLWFERDGNQVAPVDAAGGGAVDVAAFALRVASWSMENPRSRSVIILDEPMKMLSRDFQPKASEMLKQLSQKLGLQFIIVTHAEELTDEADKVFVASNHNGVTKVEHHG